MQSLRLPHVWLTVTALSPGSTLLVCLGDRGCFSLNDRAGPFHLHNVLRMRYLFRGTVDQQKKLAEPERCLAVS